MSVGKIECDQCDQRFVLRLHLHQHLKEAHVPGGEHECEDCPCVFASADKLKAHIIDIHKKDPTLVSASTPNESTYITNDAHRCKFCGIIYHNEASLKSHQRNKHANLLESSDDEDDWADPICGDLNGSLEIQATPKTQRNGIISTVDKINAIPTTESDKAIDVIKSRKSVQFDDGLGDERKSMAPASVKDALSNVKEIKTRSLLTGNDLSDESAAPAGSVTTASLNLHVSQDSLPPRPQLNRALQKTAGDNIQIDGASSIFEPAVTMTVDESCEIDVHRVQMPSESVTIAEDAVTPADIEKLACESTLGDSDCDDDIDFACDQCGSVYATQISLDAHKRTNHVKNSQFSCDQCNSTFATGPELHVHKEIFHPKAEDPPMEDLTNQSFIVSPLPINIIPPFVNAVNIPSSRKDFSCDVCGQPFDDDQLLSSHKVRSHVINGVPCPNCTCTFMSNMEMFEHKLKYHGSSATLPISVLPTVVDVGTLSSLPASSGTRCDLCQVDFKTASALRGHQQVAHVPGGFQCPECPCAFGSSNGLHSHRGKHRKEEKERNRRSMVAPSPPPNLILCSFCDLYFVTEKHCNQHKSAIHNWCSICNRRFLTSIDLSNHISLRHSETKFEKEALDTMVPPTPSLLNGTRNAKWHCSLCNLDFTSAASHSRHLTTRHAPNGIPCRTCPATFPTPVSLSSHQAFCPGKRVVPSTETKPSRAPIVIETMIDTATAKIETNTFVYDTLNGGIESTPLTMLNENPGDKFTPNQSYSCSDCNISFKRSAEARSHKKRNHVPGGKFPCKLCKCVYSNDSALQAHHIAKHKDKAAVTDSTTVSPSKSLIPLDCNYVCIMCGRHFTEHSSFSIHQRKAHKSHGIPCLFCTCVFGTQVDFDAHRKNYHRNQVPLPAQPDQPKKAGRPRKDSNRYACQYPRCNFLGSMQSSLTAHVQLAHVGPDVRFESSFTCGKCSQKFDTESDLISHQEDAHDFDAVKRVTENPVLTSSGKYSCHFCTFTFARLTAMTAHVKTFHSNESRLICFECEDNPIFSSGSMLEVHKKAVHRTKKGEKSDETIPVITSIESLQGYVKPKQPRCEICGRVFFHRRSLWSHRKRSHVTDGNFGCNECNCGFENERGLATHMLIYHGRREYRNEKAGEEWLTDCLLCSESFSSRRRLDAHKKRAHVQDGKFSCATCCCVFEKRTSLTIHRIQQHQFQLPERETLVLKSTKNISSIRSPESTTVTSADNNEETNVLSPASPPASPLAVSPERTPSPVPKPSANVEAELEPSMHKCSICSLKFGHLQFLVNHRKVRHGIEDKRCTICETRFPSSDSLVEHVSAVHDARKHKFTIVAEKELKFPCRMCDLVFQESSGLKMHKKTAHVEGGKFACKDCSCVFSSASSFQGHKIMHSLRNKNKRDPQKEEASGASYKRIEEPSKSVPPTPVESSKKDDKVIVKASGFSKTVARKKTSLPPKKKSVVFADDIVGMALSAALNNTSPMEQSSKKRSILKTTAPSPGYEIGVEPKSKKRKIVKVKPIEPLKCRMCTRIFTLQASLQDHMKKKHGIRKDTETSTTTVVEEINLDSDDDAGVSRSTPSNLKKSNGRKRARGKENIPASEDLDDLSFPSPANSPPPMSPEPEQITISPPPPPKPKRTSWDCTQCNIKYKKKRHLEVHNYISHCKRGEFACDQCECRFRIKYAQYQHVKFAHRKKKRSEKASKENAVSKNAVPENAVPENAVLENAVLENAVPENAVPENKVLQTALTENSTGTVGTGSATVQDITKQDSVSEPSAQQLSQVKQIASEPENLTEDPKLEELPQGKVNNQDQAVPSIKKKAKKKDKQKHRKRRRKCTNGIQPKSEKGFFSLRSLRERERLINWTETMHPCKVCGMKFRRSYQLYRHERINHPGPAEFLCEKCPSLTALSGELAFHEEIYHSDFKSLQDVLKEEKQKRSKKGNQVELDQKKVIKLKPIRWNGPLDLNNVIASFTLPNGIFEEEPENKFDSARRRRIRRFGIYTCRICRMMFLNKRGLSYHLYCHVGVKPYECRFCHIKFRTSGACLSHVKKHLSLKTLLSENPIEREPQGRCSHCQATFKTSGLADIHIEEVHPELKFLDMCEQASNLWKDAADGFLGELNFELLLT